MFALTIGLVAATNPNGICPNFSTNETIVASDLTLVNKAGTAAGRHSRLLATSLSLTTLGVYDGWSLEGGTSHASATANLTSVENDFIDPSSSTPGALHFRTARQRSGGSRLGPRQEGSLTATA